MKHTTTLMLFLCSANAQFCEEEYLVDRSNNHNDRVSNLRLFWELRGSRGAVIRQNVFLSQPHALCPKRTARQVKHHERSVSSDEVVLRPMTPLLLIITGRLSLLFFLERKHFLVLLVMVMSSEKLSGLQILPQVRKLLVKGKWG